MIELEEIRISDNEIHLKNNLVKSAILPQNSKELNRNLKIQGQVIVEGAVYGNSIDIGEGEVTFESAVFANSELHIENDIKGEVFFKKAVASSDTIAAFLSSGRAIFGSDVNSKVVKLKNCFISGSIFAQEVNLENCIVLGGVFATKQLNMTSCITGTFHCPSVEIAGINYILYPACFSVEPMSALPKSELYNLSLAHLGALFKGEKEDANTGKIKIDIEYDRQYTSLVGEEDSRTVINSYSVSGKILATDMIDLDKLENHFLIKAGALGSQILKVYSLTKEDGTKSDELTIQNIADFFFKILSGEISVQELSGEISYAELKRNLM